MSMLVAVDFVSTSPDVAAPFEQPCFVQPWKSVTALQNQRVFSVLFCCMGNICRSPTAEGVVRHVLRTRASELTAALDSAGTHDYHIGAAPDARAIQAVRRRGIDLSGLRARQVSADD